jgi:hypothetical protein
MWPIARKVVLILIYGGRFASVSQAIKLICSFDGPNPKSGLLLDFSLLAIQFRACKVKAVRGGAQRDAQPIALILYNF